MMDPTLFATLPVLCVLALGAAVYNYLKYTGPILRRRRGPANRR